MRSHKVYGEKFCKTISFAELRGSIRPCFAVLNNCDELSSVHVLQSGRRPRVRFHVVGAVDTKVRIRGVDIEGERR